RADAAARAAAAAGAPRPGHPGAVHRAVPRRAVRVLHLRLVGLHLVAVRLEHPRGRRRSRRGDPRVGAVRVAAGGDPGPSVRAGRRRADRVRGGDRRLVDHGAGLDRTRLRPVRRRLRRPRGAQAPVVSDAVVAALRAALGDRVDTAPASLESARADQSGPASDGAARAVVHAASVADVQTVMRIATETRTPVVAQGARTGLAGGANAGPGEIALSLRGMDRILEVRPDDLLAVV